MSDAFLDGIQDKCALESVAPRVSQSYRCNMLFCSLGDNSWNICHLKIFPDLSYKAVCALRRSFLIHLSSLCRSEYIVLWIQWALSNCGLILNELEQVCFRAGKINGLKKYFTSHILIFRSDSYRLTVAESQSWALADLFHGWDNFYQLESLLTMCGALDRVVHISSQISPKYSYLWIFLLQFLLQFQTLQNINTNRV